MIEYTIKDVIIDTEDSRVVGAIGKKVYYGNNPYDLLYEINKGVSKIGILNGISESKICNSFKIKEDIYFSYQCIIIKKEEPKPDPKYVPFSNKEEFLSSYEEHTNSMKKYGIWIFHKMSVKDDIIHCLITEMWGDGLIIGGASVRTLWKYILEGFIFEDGTPCGKEINIKQENEI